MLRYESSNIVIHLAIEAVDAKTLPVLVELDEGGRPTISLSVAMYARYLQREGSRDLPPVDVPIRSGSPGSRLLDGYVG